MSTNTFPRARRSAKGYDILQVEDFLEDAKRAYAAPAGTPAVLSSSDIRRTGFNLRRGGYATEAVDAALERLDDPDEVALMKRLALYPRIVEAAASAHEPHRIAFYLYELASEFHALWSKGNSSPHLRFIINNDAVITTARLALVQGVVSVLASGLGVLGVGAPNEMR